MNQSAPSSYEGLTCDMTITRPAPTVLLITITGLDVGEFGSLPIQELERLLPASRAAELFIDARHTRGATMDVSSEWALWLGKNKDKFSRIHMLTGSRFIELTANFVRSFAALENTMRNYSSVEDFEAMLRSRTNESPWLP